MKTSRNMLVSAMGVSLAFCLSLCSFGVGVFSISNPLGAGNLDDSVGISSDKTYTHAYNIRGADVTINGVDFTGVSNFTGVDGSFLLSGYSKSAAGGSVIGAGSGLNTLLNTFNFGNYDNPWTLTLTNLVVGESYILSFYNKAWSPGNCRIVGFDSSSGATGVIDQNMGGEPNANLMRYTFTATNITEWVKFYDMLSTVFHFFGFSVERIFNNSWSAGADWSSSVWGDPGVPNIAGANAVLPARELPVSINLDVPVTVGHIQMNGVNSWTLTGANALTLQSDMAGVSILSTPLGSHTISNNIVLGNDVVKSGGGTLTLAGTVAGGGTLTVDAGVLEIAASNTLPVGISVMIAADAVVTLANVDTQTVATLAFDGTLQHRGAWGAIGSGAQYTSDRFNGSGILEVLGGPAVGAFTASGNLGGGDLDAAVGIDSGLTYFSAVNVGGGALTINGVPFDGGAGGNPAGISFSTVNFGYQENSAQSVVSGQLGLMLNDFNYGDGISPQSLTLRNLVAGRNYTLTFYCRVWGAGDNRAQVFTTTSGATTTFNEDDGGADTAGLLRYSFIASGSTETVTITPVERSFHMFGFSVSSELPESFTNVTRRDSGSKVIDNSVISDFRIIEGTGAAGDISIAEPTTTINTLTHSATDEIATVDLNAGVLALNALVAENNAGDLIIANGMIIPADNTLVVDTVSSNAVTIDAVIGNGNRPGALSKTGSGTLTLNAANAYSGETTVYDGTLRVSGGAINNGQFMVNDATLQVDGGAVLNFFSAQETYINSAVNQTAGMMRHSHYFKSMNTVFNLTGGISSCAGEALMGVDGGTNVTVNISGSHVADWYVVRFGAGEVTVNLNSGGILKTDEMSNSGADGTVRFDGGTLAVSAHGANRTPDNWIKEGNSVVVADGGAFIDTAAGSVTINRPLRRDGAAVGGLTKTGNNTLTLTALGTYAGDTRVEGGTLKVAPIPVYIDLVNAGFELPVFVASQTRDEGWAYLSNDGVTGGWTYSKRTDKSHGGVAHNGSPWVAASAAPEGAQAGFLQRNCDMKQNITIPIAGVYKVTFKAANRPFHTAVDLALLFDGETNGFWSSATIGSGAVFKDYSAVLGEFQPGTYVLNFSGISPIGTDRATAIDDVRISRIAGSLPGSLPVNTHLTLAGGTTLDLNGANQSLAGLNGAGDVINSSSTNVTFSVGGDNRDFDFVSAIDGNIAFTKSGTGTLVLGGSNTYSGVTRIEEGILRLPVIGAAVAVDNYSFETHDPLEKDGKWAYVPTGATWEFSVAGISRPEPPWIASSAAIDGSYAGFIQRSGFVNGEISVTKSGLYSIEFLAGRRPGFLGLELFVDVDGVNQFSIPHHAFSDAGKAFSEKIYLSAGTHALKFRGDTIEDQAVWIDKIEITLLGGSLPEETVVVVDGGAVLDLNGNAQTLAGVSGGGVVSNGTLIISGTIAPGGSNMVGSLTLAVTPVVGGVTLLADVATDGTSDLLRVLGDLDLTGMALEIADLEQLSSREIYTVAECSGALNGTFSMSNLIDPWYISYSRASGEVKLSYPRGTTILIR